MARYRVAFWLKTDPKIECQTEPNSNYGAVAAEAESLAHVSKVVTILCDHEGADHPANAGKFFLERIVK